MFNTTDKFLKKLAKIKVKSFSDKLLRDINSFLNNKKSRVKYNRNVLLLECDEDTLEVVLEKNCISYEFAKDNKTISGKYGKYKDGYYVKTIDEETSAYDVDNVCSKDVVYKEVFKVFDKKGIEQFRRITFKVDNYYEDKLTGERILHEPDIMENYTDNCYMYRVDEKYILKRIVRKYVYPDGTSAFMDITNSDDCFIRYGLLKQDTKELPDCGEFYGIDKEIFFNYFQKKSTINDVVNDFHSKKYRRPCAIEC